MSWRRPDTKQTQVINSLGWKRNNQIEKWRYNKIKQDVRTMVELYKDKKDYHLLKTLYDLINEHDDFISKDVESVVLKILIKEYGKIGNYEPKKDSKWADNFIIPTRDEIEYGVNLYHYYLTDKMNELPTDTEIVEQQEIVKNMTNDELKKLLRKYNNDWDTYWNEVGRYNNMKGGE